MSRAVACAPWAGLAPLVTLTASAPLAGPTPLVASAPSAASVALVNLVAHAPGSAPTRDTTPTFIILTPISTNLYNLGKAPHLWHTPEYGWTFVVLFGAAILRRIPHGRLHLRWE